MLTRTQIGVDQSAIDTCHMCHVAVRPTPKGTSPVLRVLWLGTHPHTHHREFPGCSGKFPGCFGRFRDVSESFGKLWDILGVSESFGAFLGFWGKFWA